MYGVKTTTRKGKSADKVVSRPMAPSLSPFERARLEGEARLEEYAPFVSDVTEADTGWQHGGPPSLEEQLAYMEYSDNALMKEAIIANNGGRGAMERNRLRELELQLYYDEQAALAAFERAKQNEANRVGTADHPVEQYMPNSGLVSQSWTEVKPDGSTVIHLSSRPARPGEFDLTAEETDAAEEWRRKRGQSFLESTAETLWDQKDNIYKFGTGMYGVVKGVVDRDAGEVAHNAGDLYESISGMTGRPLEDTFADVFKGNWGTSSGKGAGLPSWNSAWTPYVKTGLQLADYAASAYVGRKANNEFERRLGLPSGSIQPDGTFGLPPRWHDEHTFYVGPGAEGVVLEHFPPVRGSSRVPRGRKPLLRPRQPLSDLELWLREPASGGPFSEDATSWLLEP